jgi:chemotaxis protein histidine kinase CheA
MAEDDDVTRFRQQVTQLGEKFLQRTRGETLVLQELIERRQQGDTDALAQLERMAHKIHGSGSMFGFRAVSEWAGQIEHLAEQLMAPEPATATDSGRMLQLMLECNMRLTQEVEAAMGPGKPSPA